MGEGIRGDNEWSESTGRIIEWRGSELTFIASILGAEGTTNPCDVVGFWREWMKY